MTNTRCKFEIEMGCDFATLGVDQRLDALRVFAQGYSLMLANFVANTELMHESSKSLQNRLSATSSAEKAKALCTEYATNANQLNSAFTDAYRLHLELLGKALNLCGVQPETAAPTSMTKQ